MLVTDLEYFMEKPKVYFLNFLCDRVFGRRRHQNVVITEGKEGYGKSTLTAADAYYMSYTLRRPLKLFFNLVELNKYTLKQETKDEIIIWDDAAISGLTIESYNQEITELIKILLLARKKRNTYFINIQDVLRLKEPIISRSIGMNRVYSPDDRKLGFYSLYNEVQIKYMYEQWTRRKKRVYKYYSFNGKFPNVLYKIFDEQQYESLKDKSILTIGKVDPKARKSLALEKSRESLKKYQFNFAKLCEKRGIPTKEVAEELGVTDMTIRNWKSGIFESEEGDDVANNKIETERNKNVTTEPYIIPKNVGYLALPPPKSIELYKKQGENEPTPFLY
jgi:hypothetical protein